jgi:hypothetical protein
LPATKILIDGLTIICENIRNKPTGINGLVQNPVGCRFSILESASPFLEEFGQTLFGGQATLDLQKLCVSEQL